MNLHEAIEALIGEGTVDPVVIAHTIQARYDKHWLQSELVASADMLIAHVARQAIGLRRRRGEGGMVESQGDTHDPLSDLIWVPETGYKQKADLTAADCRAVAGNYRRLERLLGAKAEPYETWAVQIEAAGVETVADLGAAALPEAA